MRGLTPLMAVTLPLLVLAGRQTAPPGPSPPLDRRQLSPRNLGYRITARLAPETKEIRGTVVVTIRNTSDLAIGEVPFHLYLNAFSGPDTLFMQKSRGRMRLSQADPSQPGWIKVSRVQQDGRSLVRQDLHDGTVLKVTLSRPVPPRARITLGLDFTAKLPRVFARTGHAGDFFMLVQWYPKPGVLRGDGSWHCPPFHPFSEFFADFATYEVSLRLPRDYLVGATGVLTRRELTDMEQELHFHAEDVHDFALSLWPRFTETTFDIGKVRARILSVPGRNQSSRIRHLVAQTLDRLQRWFGEYPYTHLTVVDIPTRAFGAGGMEYPALLTTWTPWWAPSGLHLIDETTVHEVIHQYFQGMVASNEAEEPWLDEGVTSYVTWLVMDDLFGGDRSFVDMGPLRLGIRQRGPLMITYNPVILPIAQPARKFPSWRQLGITVYTRAALMLRTLESLIGRRRMLDLLGSYARRFAFEHPTTKDLEHALVDACPSVLRPSVSALLQATLHRAELLDYAVHCFENRVIVERKGALQLPLEVGILLRDGRTHLHQLDGARRSFTIEHRGVRGASLGPEDRLALDPTPLDNACATRGSALRPAAMWTSVFQHLLQVLGP